MKYALALLALLPLPAMADAVVATRTLRAGIVILPPDVRVAPDIDGTLNDPAQVIGQETRVMVTQGRPVERVHIGAPTLIARNQLVTLIFERGPLRIEAEGRALGPGAAGQVIRVMNNASRVTVSGRVQPDGTVIVAQN